MSIDIYFIDIRNAPAVMKKLSVDWRAGMTAFDAVLDVLGADFAMKVENDLTISFKGLTVAWNEKDSGEHSEIGGVDSLYWELSESSTLTITYESRDTTEELIRESTEWLLKKES